MERVFITGGAGFLGRAFLRWAASVQPNCTLTIYSRDEAKHSRIRKEFPNVVCVIGDVRDYDRLELAMAGHDTVIHMAAMKYVPQGETNVVESISVNVDGSRCVARAAVRNQVKQVIGISTDKACQPVNVYGMTKLLMERTFQEYAIHSDTKFNLVRYGNVVSSTGSVIPIFRQQIKEGRITLTNPSMTRFWLSVNDAVDLVVKSFGEDTGTVLIPRLKSATMGTLAQAIVDLEDARDVKVDVIGQRFGEKVHEQLVTLFESPYAAWDDTHIRLYPVAYGQREESTLRQYISSEPDEFLSAGSLVDMIKEAPE